MLRVGKTRFAPEILRELPILEYVVEVPGLRHRAWLRPGETDQAVFTKIFFRDDYAPRLPIDCRVIVDAGANVGFSTLYFHAKYPEATIIAIEPDPENFAMLERNCGGLAGVHLVHAALWDRDGELPFVVKANGRRVKSWGRRVGDGAAADDEHVQVPAMTLDTLRARFGLERIDYLKLDIEGAEREVFAQPDAAWLDRTALIVAELHDRMKPGCSAAVDGALGARVRLRQRRGENHFFWLVDPPRAAAGHA